MFLTPRKLGETHVWDVFGYALAATLAKFPEIELVGAVVMGNHIHYVIIDHGAVVWRFMEDFHGDFSKAMCTFIAQEGYEAPRGIFGKGEADRHAPAWSGDAARVLGICADQPPEGRARGYGGGVVDVERASRERADEEAARVLVEPLLPIGGSLEVRLK